MDPQIFQKGVQRTPKVENLYTSLQVEYEISVGFGQPFTAGSTLLLRGKKLPVTVYKKNLYIEICSLQQALLLGSKASKHRANRKVDGVFINLVLTMDLR